MSDAVQHLTPEEIVADLARSDREAYFEQRIFVLSPFGTLATSTLLFVVAAGSYALLATLDGAAIFARTNGNLVLDPQARVAFILSLLMTVILGMQRHARLLERTDVMGAAGIFRDGLASIVRISTLTPTNARLGLASLVGVLLGLPFIALLLEPAISLRTQPGTFVWFSLIVLLLTTSFARGIQLTRRGMQNGIDTIENELIIDLLRIDRLSFLGRSAARFALIWFSVSAVSCLFFVSSGITPFTVSLIAIMAAMGLYSFVGMMERVHRLILAAKTAELERLRELIDAVRDDAAVDGDAATRLQGLIAYEARIAAAPEWPLDQTTLMRVGASVFILTVPWFGQAVAAYLIERMGGH